MSKNRLNDKEISALLQSFQEVSENNTSSLKQSALFKALLISINIYFFTFISIYYLSVNGLIYTPGQALMNEELRSALYGRSHVVFWLLAVLNISAYFNFGFRTVCLTLFIYALNTTIDNLVIFYEILIFENRPYVTTFAFSLPVVLVGIALMAAVFKNGIEDEEQ
ncbi:hypothetical protein [Yoonia sp.]|uniref:hypothetical protein n=1 Tax=Yoonia sp. TaxID=2212373 RepID=UPI003F7169B4